MYCRQCHYDLQGLTANRCPECGRIFVAIDESTFYPEFPSIGWQLRQAPRRFWQGCLNNRIQVVIYFLIFWGIATVIAPSPSSWSGDPKLLSVVNLKMIMTQWHIQRNKPNAQLAFDKNAARRDMQPSISPWVDRTAVKLRNLIFRWSRVIPFWCPMVILLFLIASFWRGRIRRTALILGVTWLLTSVALLNPRVLSKLILPQTHSFLEDYVYLDTVDIEAPAFGGETIAAYDQQSFIGMQRRIIGFADGHVQSLWDERAKPLFEKQGLPYPQPKESENQD